MAQTHVVLVAQFRQAVGIRYAQRFIGVVGQYRALEGIQEADAEVVGIAGRHLRVGAADADGGNARVREIRGTGNGYAGAVGAKHHAYAFADQLLGRGGRFIRGRTVIRVYQLHVVGLSADIHGGLHGIGILNAQRFLFSAGAAVAGSRLVHADFDYVFCHCDSREGQDQCQSENNRYDLFHVFLSPPELLVTRIIEERGPFCKL